MTDTLELFERNSMEFDVVIVGAGQAGLAAAIPLKQLVPDLSVVVLEKGSEVGAHILSATFSTQVPSTTSFRNGRAKTRRSSSPS